MWCLQWSLQLTITSWVILAITRSVPARLTRASFFTYLWKAKFWIPHDVRSIIYIFLRLLIYILYLYHHHALQVLNWWPTSPSNHIWSIWGLAAITYLFIQMKAHFFTAVRKKTSQRSFVQLLLIHPTFFWSISQ